MTIKIIPNDKGSVPYTVTEIDFAFDPGNANNAVITGDQLGENRRLTANRTVDLELTCVPGWGYMVQNEEYATVFVYFTDDNGNRGWAASSIIKL